LAKGQKKGNREVKKPKSATKKPAAGPTPFISAAARKKPGAA